MSQFSIVWHKEMRESWQNRKWIWLPLVFILLGAMQPVSTHFMPQILKMSGGLPAGTVIHIPVPSSASVFAKAQSQYNSLGLLVLVLAFMGSISSERQQAVLELVMVKPVSHASYILAKWTAELCLTLAAMVLGDLAAWYYTVQLIGPLPIDHALLSACVYAFWLILIVTLTTFFSVWLNSPVANAFVTLLIAAILSVLAAVLNWNWSPGALTAHATSVLTGWTGAGAGGILIGSSQMIWSLCLTGLLVIVLLIGTVYLFRRRTYS